MQFILKKSRLNARSVVLPQVGEHNLLNICGAFMGKAKVVLILVIFVGIQLKDRENTKIT